MNVRNGCTRLASLLFAGAAAHIAPHAYAAANSACGLSNASVHLLTTDNTVFSLKSNGAPKTNLVTGIDGNLIGFDFRLSDGPTGKVYGLTDTGKLYRISIDPFGAQPAQLINTLTPRFAGGFQALADFNPVLAATANALRVIGSNDQNFAIVDGAATLDTTAVQTSVRYVMGDANFGVDPNLTAGAYDNNAAGATFSTFYAIDYDLDTLVTIADRNATGSSNTGGGQLKTIGALVDSTGQRLNFAPTAGLDIFTQALGGGAFLNRIVAVSGTSVYCIDPASFNPNFPPGSLQPVVVTTAQSLGGKAANPNIVPGVFIDIAVSPFVGSLTATAAAADQETLDAE